MGDTVEQLTGIIPTVVAGGVAMKFTQAALGNGGQKRSPRIRRAKTAGKRMSNKYSPF